MRAFITGATGVLGRRVVNRLLESGHQVVGLSRSQNNTDWLKGLGAEARKGDLFDQERISEISSDCNVFLHLATAIPTKSKTTLADWQTNDHIRREGTRIMVDAAVRNKCELYLQQSVTFIYGHQYGGWVDESTPIPANQAKVVQSAVDMEQIVQKAVADHDLPAAILRFGTFYSYDSAQTRAMFETIHKGFFPIIGDGSFFWNVINVDDAAGAVLKAVENGEQSAGSTFNVCDDAPVTFHELLNFIAMTLGARKPMRIPVFLAKWALGAHVVEVLTASTRCKNDLVKEKINWSLQYPTYREGFQAAITRWREG